MNTVTLWLLIAASSSHTTPATIAQFKEEASCRIAAAELERKSRDKTGMANIYGVCVEATVVKP